uniref:Uncharacterized protein n=1 Tax=Fusarium oxysporum (strain Fo5176) TaxID=660025 RepID=A0A0D2XST0_FUSOF
MAFDLWTYQFCLACDKQVQSNGATYCSEPCQMIDSERATLPPSSQVSSPGFPPHLTKFYVPWAYGPSTARSCETTAQKGHWIHYVMPDTEQVSSFVATQNLKHANSHSSLGSMQSDSAAEAVLLAIIAAMSWVQPMYCIMSMYTSNGGPEAD